VSEEKPRRFSGVPSPAEREPPPVPQINPKVKEFMEQPLTVAECQYILSNIRGRLEKRYKEIAEKASEKAVNNIIFDPALKEVQEDILKCEEVITRGYNVQYTPPTQQNPQSEGSFLEGLDDLWNLFDQIDPELKSKMGKTLGKLFDMLNEKLGIV